MYHTPHGSRPLALVFHSISIVIHVCGLFTLTASLYFSLLLPSLFLFLFLFINKKFMANLYNSAKEGVDTNDVLSFPTLDGCNCSPHHRFVQGSVYHPGPDGTPGTTRNGATFCFLSREASSSLPSRSRRHTISKASEVLRALEGARNSVSQMGLSARTGPKSYSRAAWIC